MNKKRLITTIPERCRICYSCVRACPVKAIRITEGQADVIAERCIGCGQCFRVCGRNAKQILDCVEDVRDMRTLDVPLVAIVAPSFPAEFSDLTPPQLSFGLRQLGFTHVHDVAFGADLVARAYREAIEAEPAKRWIATSCPTLVRYVETYHPYLIPSLIPVVSPMIAEARVMRRLYGSAVRVVFVGPCVAKKNEGADEVLAGEVDAVLTYRELRRFWEEEGLKPGAFGEAGWDEPRGGLGALFPITRGILQASGLAEDLVEGSIVTVDGNPDFVSAITGFAEDDTDVHLLEILCCDGCISGAGMTNEADHFTRRTAVSRAVRAFQNEVTPETWHASMERFADIHLTRAYTPRPVTTDMPPEDEIETVLHQLGKYCDDDYLNCGACGYGTCREHAIAIVQGMAETEMCLPYGIEALHESVAQMQKSEEKFRSLFQNAVEGIFQTTADGRFQDANPACAALLGYASPAQMIEEVTNLAAQHYVNPADRKAIFEKLTADEVIDGWVVEFYKRDKSRIWVTLYVRPVFANGAFQHCEGMMLDTTDRVIAERELRAHQDHLQEIVDARTKSLTETNQALEHSIQTVKKAQLQLLHSEKMASLGGLVAGVAHEINTPVGNAVTAVSHLLHSIQELESAFRDGRLKKSSLEAFVESCTEAGGMIELNLHRAAELVQSFKRVAVDQTADDKRAFNLPEVIQDALTSLHPKLKRRHITIDVSCPEEVPLQSYPGAFQQILTNLIVNALTHAFDEKQEGSIQIEAHLEEDGFIRLTFADNGRGMEEEVRRKIFDPFFTTARGAGGSGLGMYLVYNLVTQNLHGSIAVESQPGSGTRFSIRIPQEVT